MHNRLPLLMVSLPEMSGWNLLLLAIAVVAGIVLLGLLFFVPVYGNLWFRAYMSRADITFFSLIAMGFRQVNPKIVVQAKIMAVQAGFEVSKNSQISTKRLEAHYLAGGNVMNVINAVIAAHRAEIDLGYDRAVAIDLAGRDVLDAVRTSVYPKVIDCPDPKRSGKRVARNRGVQKHTIRSQ